MRIGKGILGVCVALSAVFCVQPGWTHNVDLLRSVPLEISGYPEAASFPARFATADQVLQTIDSTPNLLIHMEALRRSYHDLDAAEQDKLLDALFKRQRASEHDLRVGFDHGYAQLVFKHNKTGLYFLRKANDRFADQFSSLAYGMAQAEADLNLEGAAPEVMTSRKLDVTFKLMDAVKRDANNHQPGFWPTYVRVVEKLKPIDAYKSFSNRDFSLVYLPFGNSVIPMRGSTTVSIPLQENEGALLSNALRTSCDPDGRGDMGAPVKGPSVSSRAVDFNGTNALVEVFNTETPNLYRVRVLSGDGHPMLSFQAHTTKVVEDLDGDGIYEIVARQYWHDPLNPVLVYRYTPCGFELDKTVYDTFRK